jgi:hypothetical protein
MSNLRIEFAPPSQIGFSTDAALAIARRASRDRRPPAAVAAVMGQSWPFRKHGQIV